MRPAIAADEFDVRQDGEFEVNLREQSHGQTRVELEHRNAVRRSVAQSPESVACADVCRAPSAPGLNYATAFANQPTSREHSVISYHIQALLVSERRKALLAEMETSRRVRQARSYRRRTGVSAARRPPLRWLASWLPSGWNGWRVGPGYASRGKRTVLRDGSEVLIRQVRAADAPLLAGGFARLSARSRQMRFLTVKKELSPAELRYLTEIDHHDHEALGAVDPASGRGVGVARYVRSAEDPQAAEIAVTVVDEWQGRGLGTELLVQLSDRARSESICRFTGLAAADNVAMARLARGMGAELVRRESATVLYEIPLVTAANPGHTECRTGESSPEAAA